MPHKRIDRTGMRYGKWTVVEFIGFSKHKIPRWRCRCDCGNESVVPANQLSGGRSKSCRACSVMRGKPHLDLSGKTFGRWSVISLSHRTPYRTIYWSCVCACGHKQNVSGSTLKRKDSEGCRSCKHKRMERVANSRYWRNVLSGASSRGLYVEITMDEAFSILEKQGFRCALTGEPIKIAESVKSHISGGTTASLDRIDSLLGYIHGNVQWLHKDVNCMKMDLAQDRFIEVCRKVVAMHGKEA